MPNILRNRLLVTTALAPFVLGGLFALVPGPADAACTVVGTGTIGALDSNDVATCTGVGNTDQIYTSGSTGVTVNIGDGATATTVAPTAGALGIQLDPSLGAAVTITNNAQLVSNGNSAIWLSAPSDNATINIAAGGVVTALGGAPAIRLFGAVGDNIIGLNLTINGTVNAVGSAVSASYVTGGQFTVGATAAINASLTFTGGSNTNTISMAAGSSLQSSLFGASMVALADSNNNTLNLGGAIAGHNGISVIGASTGNIINILSTGTVQTASVAVSLSGAGGNTLNNAGIITGATNPAIIGSNGTDTVFNSGTITANSIAISLNDGADSLTLAPGSIINGRVHGGDGTDTLGFGGTGSATFNLGNLGAGLQYREFELLQKTGASVWALTGTTAFNGAMTVDAGGLIVNGTLPSVVTVNGGYLGGAGTIGGLVVNNSGTVAPGNSIGTTNVNGNVTFNAGSTYQVEINAAGQSDRIVATGTATLNGGTVQIAPLGTGFLANTQYTIVTAAGGVTGTFASLAPLTPPLVSGQLNYDANNVYFLLQQIAGFGTLTGLTPNQFAVSTALDKAQLGGVSGPLSTAINTLAALNTPGIKAGFDDLAGQVHADGRRFTIDQAGAFQNFMWNAGTQSRGETLRVSTSPASPYAAEPADPIGKALSARRAAPAQTVWVGGYGNWDKVEATDIAFGTDASVGGAALGVDLWRTRGFAAGVAAGASTGKLRTSGRADSIEANAGHGGFYARGESGGFNLASAISYSFATLESSRTISFLGETATGSSHANTFAASLGIARPFDIGWGVTAEPFARADWYSTRQSGLSETGAPGVNQVVQAGGFDATYGTAGVRALFHAMTPNGRAAQFGVTLGARHEFSGNAPAMTAAFEAAPGIQFTITGVGRARTTALAGVEARWDLTATTSFKASYEGAFAPGLDRHTMRGTIRSEF